jgi:hypothetical protein
MKRVLILLLMPSLILGMEEQHQNPAPPAEPRANGTLMRAITASNHAAVLSALRNNQDQNYLWKASDGYEHKAYADLTAAMYALKILRKNNRWECASNIATALTWDLGNAAMKYAMNTYAAQYPMLTYVDPIRQSHTVALLFDSQNQDHQQIVNTYKPAKRIARDLLVKINTNLAVERLVQLEGYPITVETYLNNMLHSWNPVTRKDGQDLASELGEVLRAREGIDPDIGGGDGFMMREQELTMMGFGLNNNRRQRRGILVLDGERN